MTYEQATKAYVVVKEVKGLFGGVSFKYMSMREIRAIRKEIIVSATADTLGTVRFTTRASGSFARTVNWTVRGGFPVDQLRNYY